MYVMEEKRKVSGNRISSVITWEYERKEPTYTSFTDLLASSIVIVVSSLTTTFEQIWQQNSTCCTLSPGAIVT